MKILLSIAAALLLAACQTTPTQQTPAEIAAKACPPLEATLLVLEVSPALSDKAREEVARAAPVVHALCAPGGAASAETLTELANITLPLVSQAVAESHMQDKDKQNVLLAIALAQVALAAAR